ncbi:MAG TPA: FadR/GntR family transcriptional regulator [Beijerinckiaceae bacterium]|jgi:GntR family galactonate operon transcriptional repressor
MSSSQIALAEARGPKRVRDDARRAGLGSSKPGKIDRVVGALGGGIARGEFGEGAALPSEQELETRLDAGRGVVREAVKILAAKGLVSVGPRYGTRVRSRRDWNFLDADVLAWVGAGPLAPDLLRSLEEMRWVIEPAAAALAAERATPDERERIRNAYAAMLATQADPVAATQADKAFHIAILDATHNPVLSSFRGGLEAILESVFAVAIAGLGPNLPNHEAVLEAIERRDAKAARAAMERLLALTNDFIDGLERPAALPGAHR